MLRLIFVIIFIILTSYRLRADNVEVRNTNIKSLKYELVTFVPGNADSGVQCWQIDENKQILEAVGVSREECAKRQKEGPMKFYEISQFYADKSH